MYVASRQLSATLVVLCVSCQQSTSKGSPTNEDASAPPTSSIPDSTPTAASRSFDNPSHFESPPLPKLEPGVHQETASLPAGRKLRYTISVPQRNKQGNPLPLVVALHYGGKVTPFYGRDFIDELVLPAFGSLGVLVAPDSLGGNWTTPENEQAVIWLTRSLIKTYTIDPKRVALTGYSMGGMGTWFIGSRHPELYSAAIPVSGAPAGEESWNIPLYVIHSNDDEVIPIQDTRSHVENLRAKGVDAQWHELKGLTHYQVSRFAPALAEATPWLQRVWAR